MGIKENLDNIIKELPANVKLVAVSKTKPVGDILEAYLAGQRIFGENYIQELTEKQAQLPKDIQWHAIGHIQTNKVKYIASFVSLIHAVDSLKLLLEINKQAAKNNRVIECMLQIHIAEEETKFGLDFNECETLLKSNELEELFNIKIVGLMGMATNTDNSNQIRKEFKILKSFFDKIKSVSKSNIQITELSMGMSGDYKIAIEEGSTMIRVGSLIFGSR